MLAARALIIQLTVQHMTFKFTYVLLAMALFVDVDARAQGTAFTYSASFDDGASSANGIYNLVFTLYDASTGGNSYGSVTNSGTFVTNGNFSVVLDFGHAFNGANYWIELAECTNGQSQLNTLVPRAPIIPSAEAVYATTSGTAASVAAASLTGTLKATQLPANMLTNNQAAASLGGSFNGTFSGNGSALTNLSAASLPGNVVTNLAPAVTLTGPTFNTNGLNAVGLAATFNGALVAAYPGTQPWELVQRIEVPSIAVPTLSRNHAVGIQFEA